MIPYKISIGEAGWTLNILREDLATLTDKGVRHTTYFGFNHQAEAQSFILTVRSAKLCPKAVVRRAKRLEKYSFEVKAWEVSTQLLVQLQNRPQLSLTQALDDILATLIKFPENTF